MVVNPFLSEFQSISLFLRVQDRGSNHTSYLNPVLNRTRFSHKGVSCQLGCDTPGRGSIVESRQKINHHWNRRRLSWKWTARFLLAVVLGLMLVSLSWPHQERIFGPLEQHLSSLL